MTDKTLKNTPEGELSFIGKVVKKSIEGFNTSWDMTTLGAAMLGVACKGNPGQALFMLDEINPDPGSIITDDDIVNRYPFGFAGDWDKTWDEFIKGDQRAVFKR